MDTQAVQRQSAGASEDDASVSSQAQSHQQSSQPSSSGRQDSNFSTTHAEYHVQYAARKDPASRQVCVGPTQADIDGTLKYRVQENVLIGYMVRQHDAASQVVRASGVAKNEIQSLVAQFCQAGRFNYITLDLAHPNLDNCYFSTRPEHASIVNENYISDIDLPSMALWSSYFIGRVTEDVLPLFDEFDATAEAKARFDRLTKEFMDQVGWAVHLGLSTVLVPVPVQHTQEQERKGQSCVAESFFPERKWESFVRALIKVANVYPQINFWLQLPLCASDAEHLAVVGSPDETVAKDSPSAADSQSPGTESQALERLVELNTWQTTESWSFWTFVQAYLLERHAQASQDNARRFTSILSRLGVALEIGEFAANSLVVEYGPLTDVETPVAEPVDYFLPHTPRLYNVGPLAPTVLPLGRGIGLGPPHAATVNLAFSKWLTAPIRAVILDTEVFETCPITGFPRTPTAVRCALNHLFEHKVEVLLRPSLIPKDTHENVFEPGDSTGTSASERETSRTETLQRALVRHIQACEQWLTELRRVFANRPVLTAQSAFEASFRDLLNLPLQPLTDHLQALTYEVFERDPVKYHLYRLALRVALVRMAAERPADEGMVCVAIVGAGRGPLVHAVLLASEDVGIPVRILAIEKNPYALLTLHKLLKSRWLPRLEYVRRIRSEENANTTPDSSGDVESDSASKKKRLPPLFEIEVIGHDVREMSRETTGVVDIIASELLGSFSDNELAPECLFTPEVRLLRPGGMCLPRKECNYVAPVSAPRIWQEIEAHNKASLLETPYVCRLHKYMHADRPQECFTFEHPLTTVTSFSSEAEQNELEIITSMQIRELRFTVQSDMIIHGLVGYFSTWLLENDDTTRMSTLPETYSHGMFSWFPMFFPLLKPLVARAGTSLKVSVARKRDGNKKIWYEWSVCEEGQESSLKIHNEGGAAASMRLQTQDFDSD